MGEGETSLTVESGWVSYIYMVVIKHNDQGNIQKKGFFGDLVFHRDTFISVGREVLQQPLGIEAVTAGGHIFQPHI